FPCLFLFLILIFYISCLFFFPFFLSFSFSFLFSVFHNSLTWSHVATKRIHDLIELTEKVSALNALGTADSVGEYIRKELRQFLLWTEYDGGLANRKRLRNNTVHLIGASATDSVMLRLEQTVRSRARSMRNFLRSEGDGDSLLPITKYRRPVPLIYTWAI